MRKVAATMSVKLVDIARKTGYSVSTVSRALSGNSSRNKISKTTVEEIRAVPNEQRLKGYADTLTKYQIPLSPKYIVGDDFRILNGYLQTKSLLKYKDPPTAIYAAGDLIALGCIQAINEDNLNIPNDISLVTFDDPGYFAHLCPPLTAVRQPVKEMGIIAVKLLFDRIQNRTIEQKQIQLDPELIIRNSVKKIADTLVHKTSEAMAH